MKSDQILYHYTSADALLGILQSGSLWASDIRFLYCWTPCRNEQVGCARPGLPVSTAPHTVSRKTSILRLLPQRTFRRAGADLEYSRPHQTGTRGILREARVSARRLARRNPSVPRESGVARMPHDAGYCRGIESTAGNPSDRKTSPAITVRNRVRQAFEMGKRSSRFARQILRRNSKLEWPGPLTLSTGSS